MSPTRWSGRGDWSPLSEFPASSATDRGPRALVRGAGDLASGVAYRLVRAGFSVVMTEIARPTVVRRTVAFAEAVWEGRVEVEGLPGILAQEAVDVYRILRRGAIPVMVDPEAAIRFDFRPDLLVDAIMAKRNLGTHTSDAPAVVALGPGFVAGRDAHAVVETMRGPTLGRVITEGEALADTGVPGERGGFAEERVVRSPCAGVFTGLRQIGDRVTRGEPVGLVDGTAATAELDGRLRGILRSGIVVGPGFKLGDVDPRADREHCFLISDKALAVAGGVLEAACALLGNFPSGSRIRGRSWATACEGVRAAAATPDGL
jgi:xanthine dehydrogenase accessory factor